MSLDALDSLTPSEKLVLRTLLHHRDQKAIARELGLSPETVKTHLRNARTKTGVRTSFALARALDDREPPPPGSGMPRPGGAPTASDVDSDDGTRRSDDPEERLMVFQEDRAVFEFDGPPHQSFRVAALDGRPLSRPLVRLLMVAGLTLLIAVIILLAVPLSDAFQRFANVLDPPRG